MSALLDLLVSRCPFGKLGRRGERAAAYFLRREGLSVLARNVRAEAGELDIVALDGGALVFVEVKSRTVLDVDDGRTGLENIDRRKRAALRRSCQLCRKRLPDEYESYRVDGVTVEFTKGRLGPVVGEIRWYPGILDLE